MMKGVMMSAVLSVSPPSATGQSAPADNAADGGAQVVTSLVSASKQAFTSPYTVTVKKIEPIMGGNQVRVTFFVTGDDEPAHDFTETGKQAVTAFLDAGMHANVSGAGTATVEKLEAVEGGDDDSEGDSDESSDTDALSGLVANADPPASAQAASPAPSPAPSPAESASAQPQSTEGKVAGAPFDDDRPQPHVRPPHVQ
jgi:hypothetical protein